MCQHLMDNMQPRQANIRQSGYPERPQYAFSAVVNPMHIITLKAKKPSWGILAAAKIKSISEKWFSHFLLLSILSGYALLGAVVFCVLEREGQPHSKPNDNSPKITRRDITLSLWRMRQAPLNESEWMEKVDGMLRGYEKSLNSPCKEDAIEWTIWSSLFYCGTVLTTIGYGNIAPSTDAGRAVTIVYAFLGIPLMLMVLADLGKLFTKAIKFVFRYVRRFYRTGTFNKVKAAAKLHSDKPLQYMTVSWRTVSQDAPVGQKSASSGSLDSSYNQVTSLTLHNDELYKHLDSVNDDEVNHKHIEVEDEFNLPVTLAVAMVLVYMMVGAMLFAVWEEWSFFEAFYFVFISMSTVGFGDYVPMHQTYMMGAFAYLVLGLTLTSMCINVIQEKLSATFQKAKVRIGSTMGLDVNSLLREDHSRSKSFRSKSPELKKANGYRSKLSIQKESTCGSPSTPSSPNPGLDGSGSCGLGKEFLLNVPLQNRFKFYDSPYSTIHDDSGSSPSLRKLP